MTSPLLDELSLNGHTFHRADPLPPSQACEVCGDPVWVGWIICNTPDDERQGERRFDVWQSVVVPGWARERGHVWALDIHRCVSRPPTPTTPPRSQPEPMP